MAEVTIAERAEGLVETWLPTFAGAAVAGAAWAWLVPFELSNDALTAVMTIASITVGFIATAKSIVIGMASTRIVRILREAKKMDPLIGYFMTAIHSAIILSALCGGMLIFEVFLKAHAKLLDALVALWFGACTTAILSNYRIIRLFAKLMRAELA